MPFTFALNTVAVRLDLPLFSASVIPRSDV
jgi:hypothetical protein